MSFRISCQHQPCCSCLSFHTFVAAVVLCLLQKDVLPQNQVVVMSPTSRCSTAKSAPPKKAKAPLLPPFRDALAVEKQTVVAPSQAGQIVRVCCEALGSNEILTVLICYLLPESGTGNANREPYSMDLETAIGKGELAEHGLTFTRFKLRNEDGESDGYKMNSQGYPWRCWPAAVKAPGHIYKKEQRMEVRSAIADLLRRPENNRYNITYIASEDDDFTVNPPRPVSALLVGHHVMSLLNGLHPDLGVSFYSDNEEYAKMWFGEQGPYPALAIHRLGFPATK